MISYTFNRLIMQAQHSLVLTSLIVLCAIVSTVQTRSPSSSEDYRGSGRIENAYRGSGRVEIAHRGSGRMEMAYRGSGRVDAT